MAPTIGINSRIYSRNGGYQGPSFAIPIDVAMDIERFAELPSLVAGATPGSEAAIEVWRQGESKQC